MNIPTNKVSESGCTSTTIFEDGKGGRVFVLESGAVGLEYEGRITVHTIENWIALDYKDIPVKPR